MYILSALFARVDVFLHGIEGVVADAAHRGKGEWFAVCREGAGEERRGVAYEVGVDGEAAGGGGSGKADDFGAGAVKLRLVVA